jgi:hypothetical protein
MLVRREKEEMENLQQKIIYSQSPGSIPTNVYLNPSGHVLFPYPEAT